MYLPHLIGLVGLASFVAASPTPADSDAQAPKRLVVYSQDNFQGTESWGRVDVGGVNGYAGRIASVYCADQQVSQTNIASVKRTDNTKFGPSDGPGETTICRSTIDIGPCETLSASSACVPFGDELRHNIRNVYQAAGSICRYFDGTCDVATPVMEVNSHNGPIHVSPDKQTGDRIDRVRCQDQWRTAVAEEGSTLIVARTNAVAAITTIQAKARSNIPMTESTPPQGLSARDDVAYLLIWHDTNFSGKEYAIYGNYNCLANKFGSDPVKSLEVRKGFRCAFYPADNCQATNGPPHYVDARDDKYRISDVEFNVRSLVCGPEPYHGQIDGQASST